MNINFYPQTPYKEDIDLGSQSKSANNLVTKLRKLIAVCRENFQHAQELQKQYHNKYAKSRSYVAGNKVWLNSKYIKTKQNQKLKAKFFRFFSEQASLQSRASRKVEDSEYFLCVTAGVRHYQKKASSNSHRAK